MSSTRVRSPVHGAMSREPYLWIFLMIPAVVAAFWVTYFSVLADPPPTLTPTLHFHGMTMFLWVFMLVAQVWLIFTKRRALHRLVGRASFVLAPLIVWTGLVAMREVLARSSGEIPPVDVANTVLGAGQLSGFVLAWGLAMRYRRQRALHARFMVSTCLVMGTAIVIRIYAVWLPEELWAHANFATLMLLGGAFVANDARLGMRRSPYWLPLIVNLAIWIGFFQLPATEGWRSLLEVVRSLPSWIVFDSPFR